MQILIKLKRYTDVKNHKHTIYYDDHTDFAENSNGTNKLTRYDKNGDMIFYEISEDSGKEKYKPDGTKCED